MFTYLPLRRMLVNTYMPIIQFASLVLVDPMLIRQKRPDEKELDLHSPAERRRDIWPSFEEALKSLQSRPSFQLWDPRILELYVVRHILHTNLWKFDRSDRTGTWDAGSSYCHVPRQDGGSNAKMSEIARSCMSFVLRDSSRALFSDSQTIQACYKSPTGRVRAYNYLYTLCATLPVHIIYGGINDYLSAYILPSNTDAHLNSVTGPKKCI